MERAFASSTRYIFQGVKVIFVVNCGLRRLARHEVIAAINQSHDSIVRATSKMTLAIGENLFAQSLYEEDNVAALWLRRVSDTALQDVQSRSPFG